MIYDLTPDDFDNLNKLKDRYKNNIVIVKFYLPDCGPCKATIDEYNRLGRVLDDEDNYKVMQFNSKDYNPNKISNLEFGIKEINSFPTILIYKKNTFIDSIYQGTRDADSWFEAMRIASLKT